jgi:hypothetical protein
MLASLEKATNSPSSETAESEKLLRVDAPVGLTLTQVVEILPSP